MSASALAPELKALVHRAVAVLGEVIAREMGDEAYARIEAVRQRMTTLRGAARDDAAAALRETLAEFSGLTKTERRQTATAFALMLETMNVCENAYRSARLRGRAAAPPASGPRPEAIIYVLTAHPTEARSPKSIAALRSVQTILIEAIEATPAGGVPSFSPWAESALRHALEVAWRTPLTRAQSPRVKDEAEHVYATALRPEALEAAFARSGDEPFFMRSWVGGDKDGHPGVDERALLESLALSRASLRAEALRLLTETEATLALFPARRLRAEVAGLARDMRGLARLASGDGGRVARYRARVRALCHEYEDAIGRVHPSLRLLRRLLRAFPGLVVPLELRESSDVLMAADASARKRSAPKRSPFAIARMLQAIEKVARGGDPRWYARGFIISMCESAEHMRAAARLQSKAFGSPRLPVIPLFEEASSLADSENIVREALRDPAIRKAARESWEGLVELMVGYSDSAKEAGALASRLAISRALPRLEEVCREEGFEAVFFHGSGGSVDRGGGRIEDQTAWWPMAALKRYKVTVQGEMVERSFATPEIARGQLDRIESSLARGLARTPAPFARRPALDAFAARVSAAYRSATNDPQFLEIVERATPYPFLSALKIGSRPAKRAAQIKVSALRAIPWVMCWTQTRILFPTWWGLGSAWKTASAAERADLRLSFADDPAFRSYLNALGFTLAKVELAVWRLYLESGLPPERAREAYASFEAEFEGAAEFFRGATGRADWLAHRPWLGESIRLRAPMIHPLNCLQILAERDRDPILLRLTVVGISSGMMTVG